MKEVREVVAALVVENGKFMICQRPAHKARGDLWEFAGGKTEPGESRQQALVRELKEELDVFAEVGEIFLEVDHDYPDIFIHLTLFYTKIHGVPRLLEHGDLRWILPEEIEKYEFCPADTVILEKIKKSGL